MYSDGSHSDEEHDLQQALAEEYSTSQEVNVPVEDSPAPYENRFGRYDHVLGVGAFKTVYEALDRNHGNLVAWCETDIRSVPKETRKLIETEIGMLRSVKHPSIIELLGTWSSDTKVVFITEILKSGDLRRFCQTHEHVKLKVIKRWCRQILSALQYLHELNPPIIHSDLKCENILYSSSDGRLKIADLGLSVMSGEVTRDLNSLSGTPNYIAPERYSGAFGYGIDIYSFGLCVLEMATRRTPYSECENAAQIFLQVTSYNLPRDFNGILLPSLRDFIYQCIRSPEDHPRPTAAELLEHPFLKNCTDDDEKTELFLPIEEWTDDMIEKYGHFDDSGVGELAKSWRELSYVQTMESTAHPTKDLESMTSSPEVPTSVSSSSPFSAQLPMNTESVEVDVGPDEHTGLDEVPHGHDSVLYELSTPIGHFDHTEQYKSANPFMTPARNFNSRMFDVSPLPSPLDSVPLPFTPIPTSLHSAVADRTHRGAGHRTHFSSFDISAQDLPNASPEAQMVYEVGHSMHNRNPDHAQELYDVHHHGEDHGDEYNYKDYMGKYSEREVADQTSFYNEDLDDLHGRTLNGSLPLSHGAFHDSFDMAQPDYYEGEDIHSSGNGDPHSDVELVKSPSPDEDFIEDLPSVKYHPEPTMMDARRQSPGTPHTDVAPTSIHDMDHGIEATTILSTPQGKGPIRDDALNNTPHMGSYVPLPADGRQYSALDEVEPALGEYPPARPPAPSDRLAGAGAMAPVYHSSGVYQGQGTYVAAPLPDPIPALQVPGRPMVDASLSPVMVRSPIIHTPLVGSPNTGDPSHVYTGESHHHRANSGVMDSVRDLNSDPYNTQVWITTPGRESTRFGNTEFHNILPSNRDVKSAFASPDSTSNDAFQSNAIASSGENAANFPPLQGHHDFTVSEMDHIALASSPNAEYDSASRLPRAFSQITLLSANVSSTEFFPSDHETTSLGRDHRSQSLSSGSTYDQPVRMGILQGSVPSMTSSPTFPALNERQDTFASLDPYPLSHPIDANEIAHNQTMSHPYRFSDSNSHQDPVPETVPDRDQPIPILGATNDEVVKSEQKVKPFHPYAGYVEPSASSTLTFKHANIADDVHDNSSEALEFLQLTVILATPITKEPRDPQNRKVRSPAFHAAGDDPEDGENWHYIPLKIHFSILESWANMQEVVRSLEHAILSNPDFQNTAVQHIMEQKDFPSFFWSFIRMQRIVSDSAYFRFEHDGCVVSFDLRHTTEGESTQEEQSVETQSFSSTYNQHAPENTSLNYAGGLGGTDNKAHPASGSFDSHHDAQDMDGDGVELEDFLDHYDADSFDGNIHYEEEALNPHFEGTEILPMVEIPPAEGVGVIGDEHYSAHDDVEQ